MSIDLLTEEVQGTLPRKNGAVELSLSFVKAPA
jgi:hypothetical protein